MGGGFKRGACRERERKKTIPLLPPSPPRLRVWYDADYLQGLVFGITDNEVDLDTPLALLQPVYARADAGPPGRAVMPSPHRDPATVVAGHALYVLNGSSADRPDVAVMLATAQQSWGMPSHPGWLLAKTGDGRVFGSLQLLMSYVQGNVVDGVPMLDVPVGGGAVPAVDGEGGKRRRGG